MFKPGFYSTLTCNSWSAICRGATLWGLEHSKSFEIVPTVTERLARYSYGIEKTVPYDAKKHRSTDAYWSPAQQKHMAQNQMYWFIRKV